jgi:predicted alpha-1,6-mannanase (GH76 family)
MARKVYKATITHGQQLILAGKLALLTGDRSYIDNAKTMYDWLKSRKVVTTEYVVLDGVNDDNACARTGSFNKVFVILK